MNESRLDLIKKLLTLAKKSDNLSEAQSAMEKAQRIALRDGVDLNEINLEETQKREAIEWTIPQKTKTVSGWRWALADTIGKNFRCQVLKIYYNGFNESHLKVIGLESDVEVFKVMLDYAETCIDIFFKKYLKEIKQLDGSEITRSLSLYIKHGYVVGFIQGVEQGLKRNVHQIALEEGKNELMLLDLPVEVKDKLAEGSVHQTRSTLNECAYVDSVSYSVGYRDGEAAGSRSSLEAEE